jgi:hypothetical protein
MHGCLVYFGVKKLGLEPLLPHEYIIRKKDMSTRDLLLCRLFLLPIWSKTILCPLNNQVPETTHAILGRAAEGLFQVLQSQGATSFPIPQ